MKDMKGMKVGQGEGSLRPCALAPWRLKALRSGLRKPYRYDIHAIYYDWTAKEWKPLLHPPPEESFHDWIEQLVEDGDADTLESPRQSVEQAMADVSR